MSGFQRFFFGTSLSGDEFEGSAGACSSAGGLLKMPVGGASQGSRAGGNGDAAEPGGPAPNPIEFCNCRRVMRTWSSEVASRHSEVFEYPDTADAMNSAATPPTTTGPTIAPAPAFDSRLATMPVPTASSASAAPSTVSTTGQALLVVHAKYGS